MSLPFFSPRSSVPGLFESEEPAQFQPPRGPSQTGAGRGAVIDQDSGSIFTDDVIFPSKAGAEMGMFGRAQVEQVNFESSATNMFFRPSQKPAINIFLRGSETHNPTALGPAAEARPEPLSQPFSFASVCSAQVKEKQNTKSLGPAPPANKSPRGQKKQKTPKTNSATDSQKSPKTKQEKPKQNKVIQSIAEYAAKDNILAERALSRCLVLVPKSYYENSVNPVKVGRETDILKRGIERVSLILNVPCRHLSTEGLVAGARNVSPCVCSLYYSLAGAQECRALINARHPTTAYADDAAAMKADLDSRLRGRTTSYLHKLLHVIPIKTGGTNGHMETPLGGTLVIFGFPKSIPAGIMTAVLNKMAMLENDNRLKHRGMMFSPNSVIDSHCVLGVRFTPSKRSHCFVELDDTRDAAALCCALNGASVWAGEAEPLQQVHIEESRPGGKRKVLMASIDVQCESSGCGGPGGLIKHPPMFVMAIKVVPLGDKKQSFGSYGDEAFVLGLGVTIELGIFFYIHKLYAMKNEDGAESYIFYATLRPGYDSTVLSYVQPTPMSILYSPYTVELRLLGHTLMMTSLEGVLIPLFVAPTV